MKTRKVGGTSLEIVLSGWCEGRDICTPIPPEDEEIRERFGGQPRNFRRPGGGSAFYNHMGAPALREALPGLWSRAFKFSVDRHPYEKVVSRAWWNVGRRGGSPETELQAEIEIAIATKNYLNYPLYCDGDNVIVDEVWRYEDVWRRLAALGRRLGVAVPEIPPRAKSGHRRDRRPAREVLTEDQRACIARDAWIEFELLGYER
ncbi:MAG: hypothetical protein ABI667_10270 [Sphingomicrobium sp.]